MALTRERLCALLGADPRDARVSAAALRDDTPPSGHAACVRRDWRLRIGTNDVPATLILPRGKGPHPAVLYCHAHGNRWEVGRSELLSGRPALPSGPYGPALAAQGIASLAIDLPGHGARLREGTEPALARAALWQGRTLMGDMLGDLSAALGWLGARQGIDATRIATLGLSMGATHAYWLAALDTRVAAVAQLCVFADLAPLIAADTHDLHGEYMTVPGLLRRGDMGDVAALVAPRPMFVATGGRDPLTPEAARIPAIARLRDAYAASPWALHLHHAPMAGHEETPGQRRAVLRFLARVLKSEAPRAPRQSR